MEFQHLGSTQLEISSIAVGTWLYNAGIEPLRAAIDRGIRLIDTAEIYGNEGIVAEAVRGRRHEVVIATKAAPRNFRRKSLITAAEASLQRLQPTTLIYTSCTGQITRYQSGKLCPRWRS